MVSRRTPPDTRRLDSVIPDLQYSQSFLVFNIHFARPTRAPHHETVKKKVHLKVFPNLTTLLAFIYVYVFSL